MIGTRQPGDEVKGYVFEWYGWDFQGVAGIQLTLLSCV